MRHKLFEPFKLGEIESNNRMAMAPLTRNRAGDGLAPDDMARIYYEQRSSAGLIISEGVNISEEAIGYVNTPGIWNSRQTEAWKKVTGAVHKKGGRIFCQLWHCGRISHPDFHNGRLPAAPSAIKPEGRVKTYNGIKDLETPRALELDEIQAIINDYESAAKHAREAGFDGVEIHAANCYLIHQFLWDGSNKRKDKYGGPIENRSRFALEVADAVIGVWGAGKVGIKLSPSNLRFGMGDSNPVAVFTYLLKELEKLNIGYVHFQEPLNEPENLPERYLREVAPFFSKIYGGIIIANGGLGRNDGIEWIDKGFASLIAYGRLFIANPDLPRRFELNAPLNKPDQETFYGGGEEGYIDYPFLDSEKSG